MTDDVNDAPEELRPPGRRMGVSEAVLVDVAEGPERRFMIRDGVITIHTLHVDLTSMSTLDTCVRGVSDRIAALLHAH